jgi:hypothetical protein
VPLEFKDVSVILDIPKSVNFITIGFKSLDFNYSSHQKLKILRGNFSQPNPCERCGSGARIQVLEQFVNSILVCEKIETVFVSRPWTMDNPSIPSKSRWSA